VPVNQLKIYVHFSGPMSEGWAARAVRVQDGDSGKPLEGVLLAVEDELWDPERRRLTLLLDPGRIKRGLAPHDEVGYPLVEGRTVIVTVDPEFRDADGRPLGEGAQRRYEVGPPVRARVEPADWVLDPPILGSTDPLVVHFDRPLDRALLEHGIEVRGPGPGRVGGRACPGPGERSWSFAPHRPWRAGDHRLRIEARLEDLAGNSLRRVFDRDLARPDDDPLDIAHVDRAFTTATPS
jgi:hypothetical protein